MTETKPVLWCVNIVGPDDVIAVASYLEAVTRANVFNAWWHDYRTERPLDERLDARMWAVPIEWPHDAASHVEALAKPSEEYAWLDGAAATPSQIAHMVSQFLQWRLPENFNPDGGISFQRMFNEHTAHPRKAEPVGTNLFDATQAEAMVRHMLKGLPS